ncbi:N-acetylmuramoyl-L-alanine amidase family protein [Clostridium kluyveri]|uniref:N-acetylmuramoyl-L-alanine amidase family protein n=1 Tax=Clostridium kluyveri TaxID=1534 RepID=UPI0022458DB7|nr:N-acetylmuramoyl-L-alanine amidase [Clostridium kluyveri]UZQ49222.1 N-acetylmuramoyl-L-alanine amidase [Clostridium kluyveri]
MLFNSKKKVMFSCVFFTLAMLIFAKNISLLNGKNSINITAAPLGNMVNKPTDKDVSSKKYYIVLDPGHGGIDKGTSYGNMEEKNITLKIAKYAETYLSGKGNVVFLTREEDKLLALDEIGNIVNSSYADAFVSIHVNSLNDKDFKGITTLYYDLNGYQKEERIKLANSIEKECVKNDGWESRGIRRQNLAVLRYSKIPGVLVECGFITNEEDRKRLSNEKVLKKLAENISNGIINYLDESEK